jgi:ankyrin repeat protein
MKLTLSSLIVFCAGTALAQDSKPDFGRDVLPLFRQNCGGCHGPKQQIAGLRLDRRSSAKKEFSRRITPGSSVNSILYHRLIGTEFGPQMPPTGALRPDQIAVIKAWIDQGAEWPDSLANEADLPPLNPKAVTMIDMLHNGDFPSFLKHAAAEPKLLNARGPEGSTPFMYAVLYTDTKTLDGLIKQGADVNKHNDGNATALMWAAKDLGKTRLLVDHGADVNAKSDENRTPLMIAARLTGGSPIVKLLLDHGANPNPNVHPENESSPLIEAAWSGDAENVKLLLERGAELKGIGDAALNGALTAECPKCVDLLIPKISDKLAYTIALVANVGFADPKILRTLIDHGADVNAVDPTGRTALMYAAGSDLLPLEAVKLLVEKGADVNAKSGHKSGADGGQTVLDIAKLRGNTPIVQFLVKSSAKASDIPAPMLNARHGNSVQKAVQDSLPLLQTSDANFIPKAACFSCHSDSFAAMTLGLARKRNFRIDERTATQQVKANLKIMNAARDQLHQGFINPIGDFFGPAVYSWVLLGLDAEGYNPDLDTDAAVMYIKARQMPDGHWLYVKADTRPPICSDYIGQTAISLRALQLYAPKADKAAYDKAVKLAASWLEKVKPTNTEDLAYRLAGLAWAGADTKKAMQELLAVQKSDGGWSDLATMESSAYTTGKALVYLQAAGLPTSDAAYQRGVKYLLDTQQTDGSWFVKTRALAFQPFFDTGFPHGFDQFMSAAGSSWAAMALTLTLPEGKMASRLP